MSDIHSFLPYRGSPKLKRVGVNIPMTQEQIDEYIRCSEDPIYFTEKYVKFVTIDKGFVNIDLYPFQKQAIDLVKNERQVIFKCGRQLGKTQTMVCVLLWYALFNEAKTIAILANKAKTAREILNRIKMAYEELPKWIQQGVVVWNKGDIELENKSKIFADSTASTAIRGFSINCVSGESMVGVKIDGEETSISIKKLEKILANSSKYNKVQINQNEYYYEHISRQQISQNLLQSNGERLLTGTIYGNTSHITTGSRWNRHAGEYENIIGKGTYVSTPFISEYNNWKSTWQNDICISPDANWKTGKNSETRLPNQYEDAERIFISDVRNTNGKKKIRRNKNENFNVKQRESNVDRNKEKIITNQKGKKFTTYGRMESENFNCSNRQEKNQRTHGENKQESGKNKENGRKTSWHEKITGSQTKNVSGSQGKNSLEQRIEIKTKTGYRPFNGLKITRKQKTVQIVLENGIKLVCTPEHKIYSIRGWLSASDTLNALILTENDGWKSVVSVIPHIPVDVYDLIAVEQEHAFFANGIYVHNCVYLDEYAFVPGNIAEDFFSSVYPTISSGETSKIIVTSTPNGMNQFYKMWVDSKEGRNNFKRVEANWRDVPGRTQEWADRQLRDLGEEKYLQEIEVEFHGSTGTLISGKVLKNLVFVKPNTMESIVGLCYYEQPQRGHRYVITADTSRGKGLDYSAFVVIDVTQIPYKVVCTYKDNDISPILYPSIIAKIAKWYNEAYVLVEINDNGQQVVDSLFDDYEYENILSTQITKNKVILSWAMGGTGASRGILTTKSVKRLGCSLMKNMIESYKLTFQDFNIIAELSTFVSKRNSYEAEDGSNDDLVMCLVLFSWMTNQPFFSDLCQTNIKEKLYLEQMKQIDDEALPLPLYNDGNTSGTQQFIDDGCVWDIVQN